MVACISYFKVFGLAIFCLSVRFTLQLSPTCRQLKEQNRRIIKNWLNYRLFRVQIPPSRIFLVFFAELRNAKRFKSYAVNPFGRSLLV